ncbi:transcription factor MYBS2-like [Prosopis cineraria]|uniref:transcription factor MYBS2-like n=1 Tax=Prosopis cineraria TaxID=364024 RepID=UPI00241073E0|nr:transcription factor MYBS2-like [Prosopis cineraria]
MEVEVIDLTNSPPSSPENIKPYKPSRIIKFTAYIFSRKIRFKVKKSCLPSSSTFNPNPNPANSGTSLFSQATDDQLNWTPKEHQQFLMGLMKCGVGRWNKIAKKFAKNKTARQVERHATNFFISFLQTHLSSNNDLMNTLASALKPNPQNKMQEEEDHVGPLPPRTLMLFSDNGESSSTSEISGMMNTTRTSSRVADDHDDDDNGQVDLELRLG